jgi:hypothetical protein
MFSALFGGGRSGADPEEDCVQTVQAVMDADQVELAAFNARKVALITGITGQVS